MGYGEGAQHPDFYYGFMPVNLNEAVWDEADGHWGALSNRVLTFGNTSLTFLKIPLIWSATLATAETSREISRPGAVRNDRGRVDAAQFGMPCS